MASVGVPSRAASGRQQKAWRQDLNINQRAAAVLRTARQKAFIEVDQLVSSGRLSASAVPQAPDPFAACGDDDWDALVMAWRSQMLELAGRDLPGEFGDKANRIRSRSNAVDAVKRTPEYDGMLALISSGQLSPASRPRTPNPLDRTVAKRAWEVSVQDWRCRLKRLQQPEQS